MPPERAPRIAWRKASCELLPPQDPWWRRATRVGERSTPARPLPAAAHGWLGVPSGWGKTLSTRALRVPPPAGARSYRALRAVDYLSSGSAAPLAKSALLPRARPETWQRSEPRDQGSRAAPGRRTLLRPGKSIPPPGPPGGPDESCRRRQYR